MVADLELTKTERRMLDVLSDGMPHDLNPYLPDDLSSSLWMHVSNLRRKVKAVGLNVVNVGKGQYMLMRRINSAE